MKLVLGSLVMVFAAACANATPAQEKEKKLETTVRLESPVRVSWEELERSDTRAVVLAKVERRTKLEMPLVMTVELPAGVKLEHGRARLELLPNAEAVTVTERLTLTYEAAPAEDAQLKLDGDGTSMGFHYKVPYRFGRAPPPEEAPAATGPAPGKGGKSFGPSVPLK